MTAKRKNVDNYIYPIMGQAIKTAREKVEMVPQDVAAYMIDIGVNTLAGAERGYKWVSKETYQKICEYFRLDYVNLIKQDLGILEEPDE